MNSKRLFYLLVVSIGLLAAGLVGGAYGASTILAEQSKSLSTARSKTMALEQQQTQLAKAKASIDKYKEVGGIARTIVPQDKDQAQTVREIVKIAADNGVSLGTITFPSSTLGGTAGAAQTPAAGANSNASKLSQLLPAKGLNGVYTLQITVQSNGSAPVAYSKFIDFIAALENNRRTALVSAINVQPDSKDPTKVSFTLTVDEYIKP